MEHAGCDTAVQRCTCMVPDNLVSHSLFNRILPVVGRFVSDAPPPGAAPVQREPGSTGEREDANRAGTARYSAAEFQRTLAPFPNSGGFAKYSARGSEAYSRQHNRSDCPGTHRGTRRRAAVTLDRPGHWGRPRLRDWFPWTIACRWIERRSSSIPR